MKNTVYDVLKRIVQIVLPALGTFYVALADIWGFPYPTEVAGTIAAVVVFLSAILGFSNALYEKQNKTQTTITEVYTPFEAVDSAPTTQDYE